MLRNQFFVAVFVSVCAATVGALCTSNSFYLSGADASLGYAGGVSGAPALDGCYTFDSDLGDNVGYSRFGAYDDGPVLASIEWSPAVGDAWMMYQYEAAYTAENGDILAPVSDLLFYTVKTEDHPADEDGWYQQIGSSPLDITDDVSVTCGCSVSPTPSEVVSPTPEPVSPTPVSPTPVSPTPVSPTPVSPTPVSPTSESGSESQGSSSGSSLSTSTPVIVGAAVGSVGLVSILAACCA